MARDNAVCCRTRSINLLKALLVTARDQLREELRDQPQARPILRAIDRLDGIPTH